MFRDYGSVGRIPYLMPVTWEDDWPVLGVDGVVPDTLNIPVESQMGAQGIVTSDEFDRAPDDDYSHSRGNGITTRTTVTGHSPMPRASFD